MPAGCVVAACSFGFGQKNLTFGLELLLFNVAAAKNKEKPTTTKLLKTHMHMACIAKFAERARMYICMYVCVSVLKLGNCSVVVYYQQCRQTVAKQMGKETRFGTSDFYVL